MIKLISLIFLFAISVLCVLLLNPLKKKERFIPTDIERGYIFEELLPLGLKLLEVISYKYSTTYDSVLFEKFIILYSFEKASVYRRLHWAHKIVMLTIIECINCLMFLFVVEVTWKHLIFNLICLIVGWFLLDHLVDKEIRERQFKIIKAFPEFLMQLSLMVSTGLPVYTAWRMISLKNKRKDYLYHAIRTVIKEVEAGNSFIKALEKFSLSCRIKEISSAISVIIQSVNKGNSELVKELEDQSYEIIKIRKQKIQLEAERVNSKLLLPIGLILIGILIIMITPTILLLLNTV